MRCEEFSLGCPPDLPGDLALAVGTFDGVHLGHQRLIGRLVEGARGAGLPAAVLTFEPHPLEVVRPGNGPGRLTLPEEKAALVAALGVDLLLVMRFDRELAALEASDFAHQVLERMLRARQVYVGFSFSFGRGGRGTPADLLRWGQERGVRVEVMPPVRVGTQVVSSTAIREALTRGAVGRARQMLGRAYAVAGRVIAGDGRGRTLGYPTANVDCPPGKLMPAPGVYAVWVNGDQPGVANFGCRPTFGGGELRLEVYLPGASGDLYGRTVEVAFWRRLRGERAFADAGALARQLEADRRRALEVLRVYTGGTVCYNRRG
ncbi:MAG: bifunctional riboflavin kinase/FAD synthetase [Firmicutes bacterium]|nr:bifunctional riboflavin kinase/FAD synthetase [Bacillota bacterium]